MIPWDFTKFHGISTKISMIQSPMCPLSKRLSVPLHVQNHPPSASAANLFFFPAEMAKTLCIFIVWGGWRDWNIFPSETGVEGMNLRRWDEAMMEGGMMFWGTSKHMYTKCLLIWRCHHTSYDNTIEFTFPIVDVFIWWLPRSYHFVTGTFQISNGIGHSSSENTCVCVIYI
jgi:hypothetical protein